MLCKGSLLFLDAWLELWGVAAFVTGVTGRLADASNLCPIF